MEKYCSGNTYRHDRSAETLKVQNSKNSGVGGVHRGNVLKKAFEVQADVYHEVDNVNYMLVNLISATFVNVV